MIVIDAPHLKVNNLSANFTLLWYWYDIQSTFFVFTNYSNAWSPTLPAIYCNKEHQSVTLCDCVISSTTTTL